MKRSLKLFAAVVSFAALSGATFAAVPGIYAGAGLGYSSVDTNSNMPGQLSSAKAAITTDANQLQAAALTNPLLVGVANAFTAAANSPLKNTTDTSGLGGRVFVGYNFNQNFGVEAGYTNFADAYNKASYLGLNEKLETSLQALDVVGKAYLPISNGFSVYGLGGVALIRANDTYSSTGDNSYHSISTQARPKLGLGASYDIPQTNLTTSLEASRIISNDNSGNMTNTHNIPSASLVSLNLAYNFG